MKKNIEENIMKQIREGKVGLRSKYLFLAKKIGSVSGFIFSMLFSIFLLNLVLYYLKTTDSLEYLNFGSVGILAFLESFPTIFLLGGLIFTFAAGYFMAKNDISYKHPFIYVVFGLIIIIVLSSGAMASSGINDKFEEFSQAKNRASTVLKPFFNKNISNRNRGISGIVMEISSDNIELKTIDNQISLGLDKVKKNAIKDFSNLNIQKGDFIIAIGIRIKGEFKVFNIKKVDDNKLPLIRKRILVAQMRDKCDFNKDRVIDRQERIRCRRIINELKKNCGDGICDNMEKKNRILCPRDCSGE